MDKTATFEIIISGSQGAIELTPESYDIRDLKELLEDVEGLLFPGERRERANTISYRVEQGSVRNVFRTSMQAILGLNAVIGQVSASKSIDFLEARTSKAIEAFQKKANEHGYSVLLQTSLPSSNELRIDRTTHFFRSEATWVETEVYLYGKVVDAGGKEKANIHLNVDGTGVHVIQADQDFLEKLDQNILYHTMGIRVLGRQNIQTGEIERGSLKLIDLVDYTDKYDKAFISGLRKKASSWLKDVDPDEYMKHVRGIDP